MKKFKFVLPLLLVACGLNAQVGLSLKSKYYSNLIYDELPVKIRFDNYTGNTLTFPTSGTKPGLQFDIYDSRGNVVPKREGFADAIAGATFEPAKTFLRNVNLRKLYNLDKGDVYRCRVVLTHPLLSTSYMSKEIMFEVLDPPVINKIAVGLPLREGDKKIRKRYYNILIFETDKGAMYFMRIEDDKKVYKTVPLALKRTNYKPEIRVDMLSHIHILLYSEPTIFDYLVIDYHGTIRKTRKYVANGQPPRLVKDPDLGRVAVKGGIEAVEGVDFVVAKNDKQRVPTQEIPDDEPSTDGRKSVFEKAPEKEKVGAKSVFSEDAKKSTPAPKKSKSKKKSVFE